MVDISNIVRAPERHFDDISRRENRGEFSIDIQQAKGGREAQEDRYFMHATGTRDFREMEPLLQQAFGHTATATSAMSAGSTATVAYTGGDNFLSIAHLGDSPVILFTQDQRGQVTARQLIQPHRPNDPAETLRIHTEGGEIDAAANALVDKSGKDIVRMSRAFGDHGFPGMGRTPTLTQIDLNPKIKPWSRLFVAVASDGLLHRATLQELAQIVQQCLQQERAGDIARLMKDHALRKPDSEHVMKNDNLTLLFAEIPHRRHSALLMGVFDGHGGGETAEAARNGLETELLERLGPAPQISRVSR